MRPGSTTDLLLRRWHRMLALPRQPRLAWHLARLAEEQIEVQSTRPFTVARLSERADVHFAIVRARYDGFCVAAVPPLGWPAVYMLGKYTSRWAYYGLVGWLCGGRGVREVVNPGKDAKLRSVAERHGLDPEGFVKIGRKVRRIWPLLP